MAWIINIETTTTNCSVSLANSGKLISIKEDNNLKYSHSEFLHIFISDLLKDSGINVSDLKGVAISEGPGSYTGLRIGLSAAKGLSYALNIPLIAVPTLHSLSYRVSPKEGFIIPLMDARRMEVYSAIYNKDHQQIREVKAEILSETIYNDQLDRGKVYFVGNATEKTKKVIDHPNAVFSEYELPSSKEMVSISYNKFIKGHFEDVAYFEPNYLKEFKGNKL